MECGGNRLTAKGWPPIARSIFDLRPTEQPNDRQVSQRGGKHGEITIVASRQMPHETGGGGSIVVRSPIVEVGLKHVDAAWAFFHLTGERNGPPPFQLTYLQTKKLAAPPRGLGGVGVNASASDGDQAAASKEKQVAISNVGGGGAEGEGCHCGLKNGEWRIGNKELVSRDAIAERVVPVANCLKQLGDKCSYVEHVQL